MKNISDYRKLATNEKLDEIYVALANHFGKHKAQDSIAVASFLGIVALVLKVLGSVK